VKLEFWVLLEGGLEVIWICSRGGLGMAVMGGGSFGADLGRGELGDWSVGTTFFLLSSHK